MTCADPVGGIWTVLQSQTYDIRDFSWKDVKSRYRDGSDGANSAYGVKWESAKFKFCGDINLINDSSFIPHSKLYPPWKDGESWAKKRSFKTLLFYSADVQKSIGHVILGHC